MADASLPIKILADTSQANASFAALGGNVGKALGIGAVGVGATAVVQAAADYQSAMAKIQVATNNVDFSQSTDKYAAAKALIVADSTELATSFTDLAAVYAQGARFVDEFGNKLPTDKVAEYTDVVARLAKVSTDAMSPLDVGQNMDVFEKIFNQTNFAQVGSAVAALSVLHNQGEAPVWQTAMGIGQVGAGLGVTQAQALGVANYLVDRKAGGQMGGSSIGRTLLNGQMAADAELDPVAKAADAKKARTAQEHLDDLQTSLSEAQASASQMYGQHGLKTTYAKNPEAVMASDDRIAKLQRDIADAKTDQATETAAAASPARGKLDIVSMANTAGQSADGFAELFKDNPMGALLDFTKGLQDLPETARGAAEVAAGFKNIRDIKTLDVLSTEPDVITKMIATAQDQLDNPTALLAQSGVLLGTTNAKEANVLNLGRNQAANVGEPARQGLDAVLDGILHLGKAAEDSAGQLVDFGGGLLSVLPYFAPFAPAILNKIRGTGGPASPSTETAPVEPTPPSADEVVRANRVDSFMKQLNTTDRTFAEKLYDSRLGQPANPLSQAGKAIGDVAGPAASTTP
jgi:hypothetical protein